MAPELHPAEGFVAPDVRDELPGLRLRWAALGGPFRPDSGAVRETLGMLSDRIVGASVVAMRTRPVHHAYRAFFRQTGLDPDIQPPPAEQAAIARLLRGGLKTRDPLSGALLVALLETGVPVWALDGNGVAPGGLGIRQSRHGEELDGSPLRGGRLVIADRRRIHALLFGEPPGRHAASGASRAVTLLAVGVEGVSGMHLDEALWVAAELLVGS